ncbi:hypothetical protein Tco_0180166 [Tanacetum coccineum]
MAFEQSSSKPGLQYLMMFKHNSSSLGPQCHMVFADNTSGPAPQRKESSELVQNPVSPTPYVPPSTKNYEILFQLLIDEYFNRLPRAVSPDPVAIAAPRAVDPASSPSQSFDTLTKLTNNHPLEKVIGDPSQRFRQEVTYKNMPFGATLTQRTIRFHSVGNGLVEIYYLKGRIMVVILHLHHLYPEELSVSTHQRISGSRGNYKSFYKENDEADHRLLLQTE